VPGNLARINEFVAKINRRTAGVRKTAIFQAPTTQQPSQHSITNPPFDPLAAGLPATPRASLAFLNCLKRAGCA